MVRGGIRIGEQIVDRFRDRGPVGKLVLLRVCPDTANIPAANVKMSNPVFMLGLCIARYVPIPPELDLPISSNIAPNQNVLAIRNRSDSGKPALVALPRG
jgi:hypothetical protein